MTMTPEQKLAMARECAADAKEGSFTAHLAPECIEEIREGRHDDWEEVQSALIAIDRMQEQVRAETETVYNDPVWTERERCARIAETYRERDPAEDGSAFWAADEIAAAIRETPHAEG